MKNALSLILIAAMVIKAATAQFVTLTVFSQEDAKKMMKNTIVVVLLTENEKYLKKTAKKPAELKKYKETIKNYNEKIQKLIPQILDISEEVKYKTLSEIELMPEKEREKYVFMVLGYQKYEKYAKSSYLNLHRGKVPNASIENYKNKILFNEEEEMYLRWEFYYNSGNQSEILFYQNLPGIFLTEGDITFGLYQLQAYFKSVLDDKPTKIYKDIIKEKTLLINKANLDEETTDKEISKNYPYKYELVSKDVIDKAVVDKDPKYCCLIICPALILPNLVPFGKPFNLQSKHYIIEASSGKTVFESDVKSITNPTIEGNKTIQPDHLKEYSGK